jgi:hypothetical protein
LTEKICKVVGVEAQSRHLGFLNVKRLLRIFAASGFNKPRVKQQQQQYLTRHKYGISAIYWPSNFW